MRAGSIRKRAHRAALLLAALGAVGAVTWISHRDGGAGPARSRRPPRVDPESWRVFSEDVAPILARSCSSRDSDGTFTCHGRTERTQTAGPEARADRRSHAITDRVTRACATQCHAESGFRFHVGESGRIETEAQIRFAFDQCRSRARHDGQARFSRLLRMPLAAQAGGFGLLHGGGEIFEDPTEPEFLALAGWVALENAATGARNAGAVGAAETLFRDQVLGVFARNTCFASSCHVFNHSSFLLDPGLPDLDLARGVSDRFTAEQVGFNRMTSKGLIQRLVHLSGDVGQSRILKKTIPLEKGGVLHRGGNHQFLAGPEDPDHRILKTWLDLEKTELEGRLRTSGRPIPAGSLGRLEGVVFVRTRTDNARRYLDVGRYLPGGDLYLIRIKDGETLETAAGPAINLTARFHPGREADIREPDVRYDGRAVLFAMRIGEEDGLDLYEIRLDDDLDYVEGSLRRITWGPDRANGLPVHFTDPTYVPDPLDREAADGGINLDRADVVFASNLAGTVVPSVERGVVGEADGGDRTRILDFERTEVDGSFVGRRVFVVDGANAGSWRTVAGFENRLETGDPSCLTVDRPFDRPIDDSSIYVLERDPSTQPGILPAYAVYGIKYRPQGTDRKARYLYEKTLTRITWGGVQELDLSVRSTGEVFYTSQRSGCDKRGRPIFHLASCRRHLDTRFSFPTHHGNRSGIIAYADNHEMPTGIDIHVGLDPDNLWEGGSLCVSDHQFGPGLEARNPHDYRTGMFDTNGTLRALGSGLTNTRFAFARGSPAHPRFVFSLQPLFPTTGPEAVTPTGYSPGGIFRDPVPLPDGRILVSHSPAPLDHLDPDARPDLDLYVLEPDPSFQRGPGRTHPGIRKIRLAPASAHGTSEVQAVPVHRREKPRINAGRRPRKEHIIRYPGSEPDHRPARYLERNFLIIDAIFQDPSPVGKMVAYPENPLTGEPTAALDEVRFVRFVEVVPMTPADALPVERSLVRNGDPESTRVSNGIHPRKRIVGEALVHPDGSVLAKVPSTTPYVIQTLNADRMALRQEARYFFFAPNEPYTLSPSRSETFQTCAACMGSMSGRADAVFGPINPFTGQDPVMALKLHPDGPPALGLSPEDRLSFDFSTRVQPLLDRHCVACHTGEDAAAGLDLSGTPTAYYSVAYESLMQIEEPGSRWYGKKAYVSERHALAIESYLIEKIYGRELKAPRPLAGDVPHPSPELRARYLEGCRGNPSRLPGSADPDRSPPPAGGGGGGRSGVTPAALPLSPDPLTDDERLLLVRWIDLGATWKGAGDGGGGRGGGGTP